MGLPGEAICRRRTIIPAGSSEPARKDRATRLLGGWGCREIVLLALARPGTLLRDRETTPFT